MSVVASRASDIQFGIAWNWEFDHDFVDLIDRTCLQQGVSCYRVGHHNLVETLNDAQAGRRQFRVFLDRASDEDPRFYQLNLVLQSKGTRFINAHHRYQWSIDKANIHGELFARGLHLPLTTILPPYDQQPEFDTSLLEAFTKPFVVKPSRGGGGAHVLVDAKTADDVIRNRIKLRQQRVLLQERIHPQIRDGQRAYLRVYHVCGEVLPCWWDDQTHVYRPMLSTDRGLIDRDEIARIMRTIAEVAQLDFFSAEIALDREGKHVVIDYVNDPCDMRLQNKYRNGVPQGIVERIVEILVKNVRASGSPTPPAPDPGAELWP